jgi:hypothetical protein
MANKYVEVTSAGVLAEKEATVTSSGAGDANKIVALDGGGKISSTVLPTGVGDDSKSVVASETITAPALVNVWNDGGTLKARYADASAATASKRAVGFVKETITSGNSGVVYFEGTITGLSSLTPAAVYFLSGSSPGAPTATAPTASGHAVQEIGVAISDTEIAFEAQQPIIRA